MQPLVLLFWGGLVLPGCTALVGPKEIRGFEGDTVSLQCTYGEELKMNKKYWCKEAGLLISRCSGTIFSGEYDQDGRVSVHDSPQELKFKVTLRNLTLKDTGKYWCGVQRVGFDKSFLVSLSVFPGTSSHPTTSLYARTSHHPTTSPYAGTSSHPTTSLYARTSHHPTTSPYAGTSSHPTTSLYARTSAHPANYPPAGTSRPATQLDSTSAEEASFVPSSSSSEPRVSIPMIRILAPVLVLLALLLATGLAALGSYVLRRRREAQRDTETQKKEKIHLSHQEAAAVVSGSSMRPKVMDEVRKGLRDGQRDCHSHRQSPPPGSASWGSQKGGWGSHPPSQIAPEEFCSDSYLVPVRRASCVTSAAGEHLGLEVLCDQLRRAYWAPCQPRALCQPQHGDPVPEPDFRERWSLFAGPRGSHEPGTSPPQVWGRAGLLKDHLSVAAEHPP
ncbi:CMRF35-like molecule 9 isoform X3 [Camelus ferus]|uniref:CMRF35-like molecule 9 isoform X3 n=1 Tax=Camelus ferus TaxID=419612 RepID=A0A8B8R7J6_CAMFR|nr:CMRF35-like molecule 9 isoform X3 [Camelus ferus]